VTNKKIMINDVNFIKYETMTSRVKQVGCVFFFCVFLIRHYTNI